MTTNFKNQAKSLDFDYIKDQATGLWVSRIFPTVGIQLKGNGKQHQPCPICGGKDRFRCDDKHGTGSWICNQCGAGNGIDLVKKFTNNDIRTSFGLVADILGIDGGIAISEHDRQKWQQAQFAREQMEQEQKQQLQEQVAHLATGIFYTANDCTTHPYLTKKGVPSYGLKVDEQGNLLIPLSFHNPKTKIVTLCNIQSINANGDKLFMKGGLVNGAFFSIGEPSQSDIILLCEGYATGASLALATDNAYTVIVAFNANNLTKVAPIVRELYLNHRLIVCGDDDKATELKTGKNTGLNAAQASANAVNGEWIAPNFNGDNRCETGELTDFNDLHAHFGIETVKSQLLGAIQNPPHPKTKTPKGKQAKSAQSPNAPQPAPSEQLKSVLKQYAKIIDNGKMTNKIYDAEGKMQYTKTQFEHKVGKAVAKEWFMHETATIEQTEVDDARRANPNKVIEGILHRYALIFGTKEIWDNQLRTRFHSDSIRLAHPNEFDMWLKSPTRATIYPDNIWFDPSGDRRPVGIDNAERGVHYINSFNGLALEQADASYDDNYQVATPILQLLYHLCEHDQASFDWVMRWLAIPLQKLGTKMDTALIFHGHLQGAGKSLFFDKVMSEIYGQYAVTLGQGQLEEQYNEWVVDKMYAVFEEIFSGKDRYAHMGKIKQLITGKTIYISKKYSNGWTQDNFVNMVFLSNDIMPLSLEQGDRRFMVLNPNTKLPKDIQKEVAKALDDPTKKVIRAFLAVLMNCDLGEQNAHTHPPITRAKQRLIGVSMPSWERFFNEWKEGLLPASFKTVLSYDLYRLYRVWCIRMGEKACTETKLHTFIGSQPEIAKQRLWYKPMPHGTRTRAMFTVIGEIGKSEGSSECWLGYRINDFKREMEVSYWYEITP